MGSKAQALRRRIVSAADHLFYVQGYENTSFNDIAQDVRISRGNFYYHFKHKDDILSAVIATRVTGFEAEIKQWEQQMSEPRQLLHHYVEMPLRYQDKVALHGCPIGGLCSELAKNAHVMLDDANKMFGVFREWLVIQLNKLGVTDEADTVAMHLLARIQGISTMTHAFKDTDFLQREVLLLKRWLDDELTKLI